MLQARPLYDNASDARYFVTPSAWATVFRALERGLNVMVSGDRGSGKTTLLRQLQLRLRDNDRHVVFIDATAADSSLDLVRRIREGVLGRPSSFEENVTNLGTAFQRNPASIAGASRELDADLRAVGAADAAIVLVDASNAATPVYELFGRLRDTLWQFEHLWVVAIDAEDRATALRPPADSFFDVIVDLGALSTEDLTRLLQLRSRDSPIETLKQVAVNADGNPRRAVRALSEPIARGADPSRAVAAQAQLRTQAALVGRPHGMLMAELIERGQASASDRALQQTLGVTRARLNQLLRDLLERHLVIQEVEAPSGPGRPRTIYRPIET